MPLLRSDEHLTERCTSDLSTCGNVLGVCEHLTPSREHLTEHVTQREHLTRGRLFEQVTPLEHLTTRPLSRSDDQALRCSSVEGTKGSESKRAALTLTGIGHTASRCALFRQVRGLSPPPYTSVALVHVDTTEGTQAVSSDRKVSTTPPTPDDRAFEAFREGAGVAEEGHDPYEHEADPVVRAFRRGCGVPPEEKVSDR